MGTPLPVYFTFFYFFLSFLFLFFRSPFSHISSYLSYLCLLQFFFFLIFISQNHYLFAFWCAQGSFNQFTKCKHPAASVCSIKIQTEIKSKLEKSLIIVFDGVANIICHIRWGFLLEGCLEMLTKRSNQQSSEILEHAVLTGQMNFLVRVSLEMTFIGSKDLRLQGKWRYLKWEKTQHVKKREVKRIKKWS